MEKRKLEVGDVLYKNTRWHGIEKVTIDKVTPKQAKGGTTTLINEPDANGNYKLVGEYGTLSLATDKDHERYRVQCFYRDALRKIEETKFSKLSESKLSRILEIINE